MSTRGYAKPLRDQADKTMKSSSQPTWKYPRNDDQAYEMRTKRIEAVIAQHNDKNTSQAWQKILRNNSTDFPILLRFATETLHIRSIRVVPHDESYSIAKQAQFLQPFSIDLDINNEELIDISSQNSKTNEVSSLPMSSTKPKQITARSQLGIICKEHFKEPMINASSEHVENNKIIWKTTVTHSSTTIIRGYGEGSTKTASKELAAQNNLNNLDTTKEDTDVPASQEPMIITTDSENPKSLKSAYEFDVDSEFAQQMLQAEFAREHAI